MDRRTVITPLLQKLVDISNEGDRRPGYSFIQTTEEKVVYHPPVYSRYTPKTRRQAFDSLLSMIPAFSTLRCHLDTSQYTNK